MRRTEVLDKVGDSCEVLGLGVMLHVTVEGCQIAVQSGAFAVGQRLAIDLENARMISGSVRWSVGNRLGFAFDSAVSCQEQGQLSRLQHLHRANRLLRA